MGAYKRMIAVLVALMLMIPAIVQAGAITVEKDGRECILRSPTPTTGDINVLMIRLGFADYSADDEDSAPATRCENRRYAYHDANT